jgi:putative DNA primase/helicase
MRKLRDEFPGILAWLIEGYRLYLVEGLKRPPLVETALDEWFATSDHLPELLRDCCVMGPRYTVVTTQLLEAYEAWCRKMHEKPMSVAMFSCGLQFHGCRKDRNKKQRFYKGLRLA